MYLIFYFLSDNIIINAIPDNIDLPFIYYF